ncbi:hypothetical protein EPUS_07866 [Endocarpon pusillum Z07020]|uniref:F-box domain-containing protein n=1 Tax=Endocarpon pusillum (strain Z07020 / HMAS-L-300199) TaxID=1263415 RepID=U1HNG7_ENDPU|nr:uncharacterized protein EPUS_07866 [Endocarpon pusillum Z07020]ERF70569.1 hypothetical protein EPUS_07866 [Endocarpon pusillum Z07020]
MDVNTIIQRAMLEYDHTKPFGDEGANALYPWYTTQQRFLSAPQTPKVMEEDMKEQPRQFSCRSTLERLPPEILLTILEMVDIASLVAFASTNSNIRHYVRSMPHIAKILQEPHASNAIARMLYAGTARNFQIRAFMKAWASSSCDLCPSSQKSETDAFATEICLLRCCRVCRGCETQERSISFLPLSMASQCFEMEIRDDMHEGTAQAHVLWASEWIHGTGRLPAKQGRYKTVQVISTDVLMRMVIDKYRAFPCPKGFMGYIRDLVHKYMRVRNISRASVMHVRIAKALTIRGFGRAVDKAWEEMGLSFKAAKRSLIASLPYLESKGSPMAVDRGFTCEGCFRDERLDRRSFLHRYPRSRQVWLRGQVMNHFIECATAQAIAAGGYLTIKAEDKLLSELLFKACSYWREPDSVPQMVRNLVFTRPGEFNWTAHNFMLWHQKTLKYVTEKGEDVVQRRERMENLVRRWDYKKARAIQLVRNQRLGRIYAPSSSARSA